MRKKLISFITTSMFFISVMLVTPHYAVAATQEIEGIGKYIIGEGDDITPEEATKRALKLAKEDAAIKTPIFFEEAAETKDGRLNKDEMKVFSSISVYFENGNIKDEYKTEYLGNGRYQYSCRIVVTIDTDIVKDLISSRSKTELYETKRQLKELEEEELKIEAKRREIAQKKKSLKNDENKYLKAVTLENDKKEEALDLAKKSIASYLQKDYTKAIEFSKKAINLDPALSVSYRQLGQIYSDFGDYNKAMENFDKALKLNPKDAETYSSIGNYSQRMGNPKKAEESYKMALDINPQLVSAWVGLGDFYTSRRNYTKAKECVDKIFAIDANNGDAYYIMGTWSVWRGNIKQGIDFFKKAEQNQCKSEYILNAISECYDILGDTIVDNNDEFTNLKKIAEKNHNNYIKRLENIVAKYPDNAVAWQNLGDIYYKDYERDKANECYEKAIKLYPEYVYVYTSLGDIDYYNKHYKQAIVSYEKAYKIVPNSSFILADLSYSYLDSKNYDKAIEYAKKCVDLYPDYDNGWRALGKIYQELGKGKEAVECMEKVVKLTPGWTMTRIDLGDAYFKLKQYEKAILAYEESIHLSPIFTTSYMRMGRLYSEKKDYENALIYYKKTVENANPRANSVWSNIGKTYAKLNRLEEGEKYIYEGISKIPDSYLPWVGLSDMYEEAGLKKKQEECCIKAIEALPNEPYIHLMLAKCYMDNNIKKSVPPCKKALSLIENDKRKGYNGYTKNEFKGLIFYLLSFTNMMLGEFAEAEFYSKKAVELEFNKHEIFEALCISLFMQDKYQESVDVLDQIIKNTSDEKKFNFSLLSGFYIVFDKYDMGIDHLQKLSSKYTADKELWEMLAGFCHIQGRFNEAVGYYEKALTLTTDEDKQKILTRIEEAKNGDSSKISAEFERGKQEYYNLYRDDNGGM